MGTKGNGEDSTICGEGCAMSSLSMALYAFGAVIPFSNGYSQPPNPLTFNAWLEANNGYECAGGDCNNLILNAVGRMNSSWALVGEIPPPSITDIEAGLTRGDTVYLAHVTPPDCTGPCHFVLLTGTVAPGSGNFTVNDPYYNTTVYPWSNIHDIIVYTVAGAEGRQEKGKAQRQRTALPSRAEAARVWAKTVAGRATPITAPVTPISYPLYKQCDDAWGYDRIGSETDVSICDVGCLMSSISMALARNNITVPDLGGSTHWSTSNPQSLNTWLQLNNGYVDGDDFDEGDLPALDPVHVAWNDTYGMHTTNDVPMTTVQHLLSVGQPVIANVMAGHHFVLVIGWDDANQDTLLVNDPGFNTLSYSYSKDVVGWRLFNMTAAPAPTFRRRV